MNTKQFILLATACACVTSGLSAAVTQMTEQEIAEAIKNREVSVNDAVLYDGAVYTVSSLDVTTNGDYQRISFQLEKPFKLLGTKWGKNVVSVNVKEGTEPLYPHQKVKNENATNDTQYAVNVYRYRNYNDTYYKAKEGIRIGTIIAILGTYAYCVCKCMP